LSANRNNKHDLPTPESPINTSLKRKSLGVVVYVFFKRPCSERSTRKTMLVYCGIENE